MSSGKVVLVRDSQMRRIGRDFSAKDPRRSMCVCLPGVGVGDVADRLEDILGG